MAIEASGAGDEVRHVKRQETVAIETARIALRQHKGLGGNAVSINVTEIGAGIKAVVASGTEYEPTGIGAPVVERLGILRVCPVHGTALSCSEVEQIEVGFVVPDAELSVVGERVAQVSAIVGGTGEGYRLLLSCGIDDDVNGAAEGASGGVEVDAAEVIADGV